MSTIELTHELIGVRFQLNLNTTMAVNVDGLCCALKDRANKSISIRPRGQFITSSGRLFEKTVFSGDCQATASIKCPISAWPPLAASGQGFSWLS